MSTESATILFTDQVGSTALSQRLSAAAADEVRREHFSILRQAIAEAGGTEVKNLGDGLMVVFASAAGALACSVAMQQGVERDNHGREQSVDLRVGLSVGEVSKEDGDYFGDPVIEAARLCAKAEGGQILVADAVRVMAGRRSPYAFISLGELELKGLPDPVETLEVGWEPLGEVELTTSMAPLPARLELTPITGVVARDAEAEILTDAFKRVAASEGREVVLISGEAGLGKTTLVAEAARRGFASGACVLLGRCQEDLSASYSPFAEAVHHYVAHAPIEVLTMHVAAHGGELARMVPSLRQRLGELPAPQSSDPDTERYLLYGAVVGLLSEASATQPLVLVLDDLQWADKPSLQLLRHIVANVESARLLVLATFRDAELSGSHPLTEVLGALRREPGVRFIDLKGFDDTGVLAFMEAAAGQRLEDDGVGLAHALYRETDGNPFFVGEVLRDLIETNAIYQDDSGRWVAAGELSEMALPSSVRQVISARVSRLGERAGQVLSIAAVIGRDFDFDLLDDVTELSQDDLLDTLDAAAAAALVREVPEIPGRWSFSHALTQHTLYQDLGATRRARTHRKVAEALEIMCGNRPGERVGELAHHWSNATQPVDADKAVSYARQAGEAALAALAPDDAVRYFAQAMEFFGQQRDSEPLLGVDLLLGLGTAQRQAGIAAFRETFLDAAHRAQVLGAADRLVTAALANSRGIFSAAGVVDTDKVAVLEAAIDALAGDHSPERAMLLATLANELSFGPLEQRLGLADDAVALARQLGDPAATVHVLNLVNDPLQVPSALVKRMANTAEALVLAEGLGDPGPLFWAALFGRVNAVQAGDFALGTKCLQTMRTLSDRLRQPTLVWLTTSFEVGEALVVGDADRAETLAATALQLGNDSGQPDAFAFYGSQLFGVRFAQGRAGELVALIEQIVADNPGLSSLGPLLAMAHFQAGDDARALELLEAAAADGFASLPLDILWISGVICYAYVAVELDANESAQQLYDVLAPYREQLAFAGVAGVIPVAMGLGGLASLLGRYDEAEVYFSESNELNERGQMEQGGPLTELWWAQMLAARRGPGDLDRARALLEHARDGAVAHGYAGIERKAIAELSNLA